MSNLLVFGDSIACGQYDKIGGWVHRLKLSLDQDKYCLYNLAIDGDTSDGLIQRFESELKPRLSSAGETIVIVALGINDSAFDHKLNDFLVSKDKFKQNIKSLIAIAKKYSQKIIFVGPTPVDDAKVDPIPWAPNFSYKKEDVSAYSQIIEGVCEREKVTFIDLFNQLNQTDFTPYLSDGAHPNSSGHKKIFELVYPRILNHKV